MKIAFLVSGNYNTSLYSVTKETIDYLRMQGVQVDLIFLDSDNYSLLDSDNKIDIEKYHQGKFNEFFSRITKKIIGRHAYDFLRSRWITKYLEEDIRDYDIIFVHGSIYILLHTLSIPHMCVLHSCKFDNFLGHRRGLKKKIYQYIYRRVYDNKYLLTVSESVKLDLIHKMRSIPLSIETIYNGFNFKKLVDKSNEGDTQNVPENFIMAAGRPDRTKRFDILLQAYAKSRQKLPLVIFGDGRNLNKIKRLAIKLKIDNKVIFWGFCNDLLPYFKQASAYILSSDVEGLPTVVIESLAVGTPVVATDVGGVSELLGERLKEWIVPRRDVDALARKIDQVLESPPLVGPEDLTFLDYRVVGEKYKKLSEKMKNGLL
ncbi:glycosyltransferase [Vibrio fujianensis]|uniref:glycosyltransferase n=1 Tax=Vibrio fujianensis TaxID=1974215 RepID=UPI000C17187E|nr:glycosyltransferase [Vibrio fujianensis]